MKEKNCNKETILLETDNLAVLVEFLNMLESKQPPLTIYALATDEEIYAVQVTAITLTDFLHILSFYLEQDFTVFTTEGVYTNDEERD